MKTRTLFSARSWTKQKEAVKITVIAAGFRDAARKVVQQPRSSYLPKTWKAGRIEEPVAPSQSHRQRLRRQRVRRRKSFTKFRRMIWKCRRSCGESAKRVGQFAGSTGMENSTAAMPNYQSSPFVFGRITSALESSEWKGTVVLLAVCSSECWKLRAKIHLSSVAGFGWTRRDSRECLPAQNALSSATAYEIAPQELFALFRSIHARSLHFLGIYHSTSANRKYSFAHGYCSRLLSRGNLFHSFAETSCTKRNSGFPNLPWRFHRAVD